MARTKNRSSNLVELGENEFLQTRNFFFSSSHLNNRFEDKTLQATDEKYLSQIFLQYAELSVSDFLK